MQRVSCSFQPILRSDLRSAPLPLARAVCLVLQAPRVKIQIEGGNTDDVNILRPHNQILNESGKIAVSARALRFRALSHASSWPPGAVGNKRCEGEFVSNPGDGEGSSWCGADLHTYFPY